MPARLKPYDRVRVVSDRFRDEGAPPGSIGYIIEKWEESVFEVEVSREDGTTIAQFVAKEDELELAEDEEHYRVLCIDCQGAKKCNECEGTGKWAAGACPYCGGDGKCHHCGGKGFITEAD